jgi:ABC-type uncharacterized transport system substrate-binding protein
MPFIGLIKYRARSLLLALVTLLASGFSVSGDLVEVDFIVVKNDGVYRHIIELTEKALVDQGISIDINIVEADMTGVPRKSADKIITIGTQAAEYGYRHYAGRAISSALITRSGFEQLAQQYFGSAEKASQQGVNPVLLDQPLLRYFNLGRLLVPSAKKIGILVGPSSEADMSEIRATARSLGLEAKVVVLSPDTNPIRVIEPIMSQIDYFVVLPDRKLINQMAARWVLPLSYRYRKPLIAYSHKYVEAGALASVFSSPQDVARAIASELAKNIPTESAGAAPFSVSLNAAVSRSLGIQLNSAEHYQRQLHAMEGMSP